MDFTEAYSDRCSVVGLAVREGNVKMLRKLIKQGYSIDVQDNRGWMPIHEAAAHNFSQCLRVLVNAASSDDYINSKTFDGLCALHLSARHGSLQSLRVLLEAGADPNQVTIEETTALFLGLSLEKFVIRDPLNFTSSGGCCNCRVVKCLLQNGLCVPREEGGGRLAFLIYGSGISTSLTKIFVDKFPILLLCSGNVKVKAVENGHTDIVKFLIQHGANVKGPHSWSGWNSLHEASFQGYTEIMEILLEKGASKECKDNFGITPLFVAAQYGKLESLRLLVSHGAEVNCQAKDKATPLLIAAQEGHTECVELLLSKGADPNLYCNNDNWQLPIHAAAQMGHKRILELLIPITDRICDKGEGKVSPVYSAVYGGNEECLEMLLREGYSPDAQECLKFDCVSPMCMVFQKKLFSFIDIFLKYGITLLGINLGYCLFHEKFTLFQRFLKLGCLLPSGDQLLEFVRYTVKAHEEYKEWLPYLLLAGFNPVNLMHRFWIFSVSESALNFILEFTDWKRLPPHVQRDLSDYKEKFTWTPKSHFASIPSLSHLCRLEIRSVLTSEHLRSDQFIRELPLPTYLQDYLLYLDVLRANSILGAEDYLGQREEGATSTSHSSAEDAERRDITPVRGDGAASD